MGARQSTDGKGPEPNSHADASGSEPLSSLVDTRRGATVQYTSDAQPHSEMAPTQPGLGAQANHDAWRRSGTHVRVSTQSGSRLTPTPPQGQQEVERQAARARHLPEASTQISHDTLRGLGADELADLNKTVQVSMGPLDTNRPPTTKARATNNDVITSAFGVTLPIGTRLPASVLSGQSDGPKIRGFATQPPVTPKVYTAPRLSSTAVVDPTSSGVAFPTSDQSSGRASNESASSGTISTGSISTERSSHDRITADVSPAARPPRDATQTLQVPVHRPSEETFRPSAHTTPPVVVVHPRRRFPAWPLVLGGAIALVAVGAFAVRLESKTDVQGVVVLQGGPTPVLSQIAGPITKVLVKPGDTVAAGQAVVEMDASAIDQRRAELREREATLTAERERAAGVGSQLHAAATQALQRKRGVLWERLKLHKDSKSSETAEKSLKDVQSRDALLLIRQELADVEFELNRRQSDRETQEQTWEHQMRDVRLALEQLDTQSPSVLSPVAGRVDAVLATPGTVLTAGNAVAHVVPEGAETQVVLVVPTASAASLSAGAQLPVRFASLPPPVNTAQARVTRIGDAPITREEAVDLLKAPMTEPMVRLDVELFEAPTGVQLRLGERVVAEIPGEKRSLWQYLTRKTK